jgi:hypothetical protein
MQEESRLHTVAYWYSLAEEAMLLAQQSQDLEEQKILIRIAESYEKAALRLRELSESSPDTTN